MDEKEEEKKKEDEKALLESLVRSLPQYTHPGSSTSGMTSFPTMINSIVPGSEYIAPQYDFGLNLLRTLESGSDPATGVIRTVVPTDATLRNLPKIKEIEEIKKVAVDSIRWRSKNLKRQSFQRNLALWIITALVFTVVVIGLVLTYQFSEKAIGTPSSVTLDFRNQVFTVGSSIPGVIVLGLSLGFFYLYLRRVYGTQDGSHLNKTSDYEKLFYSLLEKHLGK